MGNSRTADVVLSYAMTPYDRVMPLISGEVKPAGITLDYQGMPGAVPGVFYEQIKFQRYDLSEMSFSSGLVERSKGWPYRLLPVFHNRNFSYTNVVIRKSSGIRQDHPEDLKGKRFGVQDYQQTAALWIRGVLQHEFDVRPEDIEWRQTRSQQMSHLGASGTQLPPGVHLQFADADVASLFLRGDLDAAMSFGGASESSIDRPVNVDLRKDPDYTTLFSDPKAEAMRYYRKNGIFPPHHTTAIRASILEQHPWVARSLMDAFEQAKKIAIDRLQRQPPTLLVFGAHYLNEVRSAFGPDPFAYGVKANAKAIDMVQQISVEQGLTPKKQPLDEIFPEEVILGEERLGS